MKFTLSYVPLAVFLVLVVYFSFGLTRDSRVLQSVLIDKPVPQLELEPILGFNTGFSTSDLKNQVTLVNIFGSWCIACMSEHSFLMDLKNTYKVKIYGIDWRELNQTAGPEWLKKNGNPYARIGNDPKSKAAIAFGVTGAPETFIVDHLGVIRYKHTGPLTYKIWKNVVGPIYDQLRYNQTKAEDVL